MEDDYVKITFGVEVEHDQPIGPETRKMIQLYGVMAMAAIIKAVTGSGAGKLTAMADGQYPEETERIGWWLTGVDDSGRIFRAVSRAVEDSIEHSNK